MTIVTVAIVLFIFDFIELTRITTSRNVSMDKVFIMSLQKTPMHLQKVFGFLVLIASILMYMKLSKNNELVILKASGLSVYQYLISTVLCTLVVGIVYVTAINPITSILTAKYKKNEANYLKGNPNNLLAVSKTGLWVKQINENGEESIIHSLRIGKEHKQLHEVTFYFLDEDKNFIKRVDADIAKFSNGIWQIDNAKQTSEGSINEDIGYLEIRTNITFDQIQESLITPESLSFWKLPNFITIAESSGLSAAKHKLYFYRLLISPVFFVAMILLGAAFFMMPPRLSKGNIMIISPLMIGFFIYFFSDLIFAFAASGEIPIWLGALSPTLLSLVMAVLLLLHFEEVRS
jgi:lipopolysaccharide export system permease protein